MNWTKPNETIEIFLLLLLLNAGIIHNSDFNIVNVISSSSTLKEQ